MKKMKRNCKIPNILKITLVIMIALTFVLQSSTTSTNLIDEKTTKIFEINEIKQPIQSSSPDIYDDGKISQEIKNTEDKVLVVDEIIGQ